MTLPHTHHRTTYNAPLTLRLGLTKYPIHGRPPVGDTSAASCLEYPGERVATVERMVTGVARAAEMEVSVGAEEDKV